MIPRELNPEFFLRQRFVSAAWKVLLLAAVGVLFGLAVMLPQWWWLR